MLSLDCPSTTKREAKVKTASPFQTKLATNLTASRQSVFSESVKHCPFKVSACSPEKMESDVQYLLDHTNELVVVLVQLLLSVPAVVMFVGVSGHLPSSCLLGWELEEKLV